MKNDEARDQQGSNDEGVTKDPAGTTPEVRPSATREAQDAHEKREKPGLFSDRERAVRTEGEKDAQADERAAGDTAWPQKQVGRTDSRSETGAVTGAETGTDTGATRTGSATRETANPDRTALGDDKTRTDIGTTGTDRTAGTDRTGADKARSVEARADSARSDKLTADKSGTDRTATGTDTTGADRTASERTAVDHKAPVEHKSTVDHHSTVDHKAGATTGATADSTADTRLLPQEESDKLAHRLQEALGGFVDGPRRSVEEAAGVLEEATEHITRVLDERRRSMRAGWDGKAGKDGKTGTDASADGSDTEDLRLALRNYREVTERLLKI